VSITRQRSMLMFIVLLLVLALAGCQQVSDARSEFCTELRDIGAKAVELKAAKVDEPIAKYQNTIDSLAAKRKNVDRLARLTSIEAIAKLDAALDKVAQVYATVQGNVLGPVADKLTAAAGELQQAYSEINDAVCAAK
jgi:C4-dicarboxylate-specific signal transduction histidine kinase